MTRSQYKRLDSLTRKLDRIGREQELTAWALASHLLQQERIAVVNQLQTEFAPHIRSKIQVMAWAAESQDRYKNMRWIYRQLYKRDGYADEKKLQDIREAFYSSLVDF
jgi:hypothetical protein